MAKFTQLEGRNTPPLLPINWADWEADEHVKQMNETMQGVFFLVIKALWKEDQFEFDYRILTQTIGAKDWRNVRTFLEKWGHLFRCTECDGALNPRWEYAQGTHPPCRYCVGVAYCSCTGDARFAYHPKLKNYKDTANSGSRLGTIQYNGNKLNSTATEPEPVARVLPVTEKEFVPVSDSDEATVSASKGFAPSTFNGSVTAVKSGKTYPPVEVRRILDYIFVHKVNPKLSEYWIDPAKGNITSASRLAQAIHTMAEQVPADWTPPAPKPIRPKGDPNCRKCFGRGLASNRSANDLSMSAVPCECTKVETVATN